MRKRLKPHTRHALIPQEPLRPHDVSSQGAPQKAWPGPINMYVRTQKRFSNNSFKQSDKRTNKYVQARQYLRQNTWHGIATRGLAMLGLQTRILQNLPVTKKNRAFTQKHRQHNKRTYWRREAKVVHARLPNVGKLRTSNSSVLNTETGLGDDLWCRIWPKTTNFQ